MPAGMTTIIVNDDDKNYDENVDTTDFAMNLIFYNGSRGLLLK